jgi:lipid-A-disaccharide synthase
MKVFWIAGEPSGDLQASALVAALQDAMPEIEQAGWGGTRMAEAGMKQIFDLPGQPIMGFVEVALRAKTLLKQVSKVKNDIASFGADLIVLVDYAGFNLRIAQWAKRHGIKVVYFIPPKIWAWKESRLKPLSSYSDLILSILPFEEQWYREKDAEAHYVGNPLLEQYAGLNHYQAESKKIVLLPGSRLQEVSRLMPQFTLLAKALPEYTFHVVRASSIKQGWPIELVTKNMVVEDKKLSEVTLGAEFALTCSGTASLEIALLGIPQSVVYRANPISLAIAKQLVKVKYFSLPNLIMDAPMVPEFLQDEVNLTNMKALIQQSNEVQLEALSKLHARMGSRNLAQDAVPRILALLNE